ncbi:MAG: rhomboid family intramembrane serine protease [Trueperaceae bacterium]
MFPLRDANPRHGPAVILWLLIAANVGVFLYNLSFDSEQQLLGFVYQYGFIPREFFSVPLPEAFTLISSMFLHGGVSHILGNMFFLYVFGDNIEDRMGHVRFTVFYLLGGVLATLAHGFFTTTSTVPMVGASGAISAILGAYIVIFPRQRILTFIPPLLIPWIVLRLFGRIPKFFLPWLPAWIYLGYWIGIQMLEAYTGFVVSQEQTQGVAWWAHIGGFIYGVLAVRFFLKPTPRTASSLRI